MFLWSSRTDTALSDEALESLYIMAQAFTQTICSKIEWHTFVSTNHSTQCVQYYCHYSEGRSEWNELCKYLLTVYDVTATTAPVPNGYSSMCRASYAAGRHSGLCGVVILYSLLSERCCRAWQGVPIVCLPICKARIITSRHNTHGLCKTYARYLTMPNTGNWGTQISSLLVYQLGYYLTTSWKLFQVTLLLRAVPANAIHHVAHNVWAVKIWSGSQIQYMITIISKIGWVLTVVISS